MNDEHDWYEVDREITDDGGTEIGKETIYWCRHCDATKDSDGGIIA